MNEIFKELAHLNVLLVEDDTRLQGVLAGLLIKRGVETFDDARSFFRPSLDGLHNPFLMRDMDEAVERLHRAIVSKEKITEMGAKNAAEVLQNIPGVTVTEHPMEGVSMQGFSGAYVKVLIDGVAVGGDVGGASPIALIPASDIDHIEIVKGASSALYGSDAMGGVINIITKKNRTNWSVITKQEIDIHKHYYGMAGVSF